MTPPEARIKTWVAPKHSRVSLRSKRQLKRPKFHPMDLVRVKTPGKYDDLGPRPPGTLIMGKTATVEIAGLINGATSDSGESMVSAYYIRIDNLPAILIHEEWLEEV